MLWRGNENKLDKFFLHAIHLVFFSFFIFLNFCVNNRRAKRSLHFTREKEHQLQFCCYFSYLFYTLPQLMMTVDSTIVGDDHT